MPLPDPDEALLAALRRPADEGDDPLLARLRVAADALTADREPMHPVPPSVWRRIASQIQPEPAELAELAEPTVPAALAPVAAQGSASAPAHSARRRRFPGSRRAVVAALAAVTLAVVAIGVRSSDGPDVVAEVALQPVGDGAGGGAGVAKLVRSGDHLRLDLRATGLMPPPPGSYYELWLIDPSISRLVSLGPIGSQGRVALPAGLDAAAFPIVDVSTEPLDGNPSHSGHSVLRGVLPV